VISNIFKKCRIPRSGPGALPHLKVRRIYSKWGFYLAPRCAELSIKRGTFALWARLRFHTPTACTIERHGADGGINPASFYSSGLRCRPQKMLKHLLLYSIVKDFIGALGVLNFSKDTLRVLLFAVAPGRLEFVHPHALTACCWE